MKKNENRRTNKTYSYSDIYNTSLLIKLRRVYKQEGVLTLLRAIIIRFSIYTIFFPIFKINYTIFNRYFIVDGKKMKYFININNAVQSERVIEISFARGYLLKKQYDRVLEIGNVLSHYFNIYHTIVDKYEKAPGVINVDVLDFHPDIKYDLIISISTIEHIGFDESTKEDGKSKKAMLKIIELLDSKGTALITVPLGYNPEIDYILKNNEVNFTKRFFLKRVGNFNLWKETTLNDALQYTYGSKYPAANSVAFLLYEKEE